MTFIHRNTRGMDSVPERPDGLFSGASEQFVYLKIPTETPTSGCYYSHRPDTYATPHRSIMYLRKSSHYIQLYFPETFNNKILLGRPVHHKHIFIAL